MFGLKGRNRNGGKGCSNPIVSKKERKELFSLLNNINWCDEDSVFDLGVELGRFSVFLRSRVLEMNEEV